MNLCKTVEEKKNPHNIKLTADLKNLNILHCQSLPHRKSHYSHESFSLNYFENPALNLTVMYNLFIEYYWAITGKEGEIPFGQSTYENFFNHYSIFTFQMPRTDVCNTCYESEKCLVVDQCVIDHK